MPSEKQIKKVGYGVLALGLAGLACAILTNNAQVSRDLFRLSMGTGALGASIFVLGKTFE